MRTYEVTYSKYDFSPISVIFVRGESEKDVFQSMFREGYKDLRIFGINKTSKKDVYKKMRRGVPLKITIGDIINSSKGCRFVNLSYPSIETNRFSSYYPPIKPTKEFKEKYNKCFGLPVLMIDESNGNVYIEKDTMKDDWGDLLKETQEMFNELYEMKGMIRSVKCCSGEDIYYQVIERSDKDGSYEVIELYTDKEFNEHTHICDFVIEDWDEGEEILSFVENIELSDLYSLV